MKKVMFCALLAGMIVVGIQSNVCAGDEENNGTEKSIMEISGFGYFMFGQIVSGIAGDVYQNAISHYWQDMGVVNLTCTSRFQDWFYTKIGLEMSTYFPVQFAAMDKASYYIRFNAFLPYAEGVFDWKFENSFLSSQLVEAGLFQYTFNKEVKNLGNYLYRSTAKPLSVQTRIDYPWADMMGIRTQTGLFNDQLKIEAIMNTVYDYPPWYDWNLGLTAAYSPHKVIDVGAGICWAHLIPASCGTLSDSLQKMWQATKLDFRAILDPKSLMGEQSLFGAEDGKIYAELGVIGLKDTQEYPYIPKNDITHRMPFLLGINIPTFKFLDVFSVELEWFNSPYPNDWFGRFDQTLPLSRGLDAFSDSAQIDNYINQDNFKWTVFLKKSIAKMELRAYLANDHSVYKVFKLENLPCFEQTLKRPQDWQWFLELRFNL